MNELFDKWPVVLACVISINLLLSGAYAALGQIKDHTKTDLDNKAHGLLGKFVAVLQKILEFISANPKNK